MKLYGDLVAPTTQMVALCAAIRQATPEFVLISLPRQEQHTPDHLKRHPFGLTPVIEHDGDYMYEARAIIRYLDRVLPGEPLTPTRLRDYALMEQFIGVEQSYFSPHIMTHYYAKFVHVPTSAEALTAARERAGKALDVVEAALESSPYLAGERFSLAEIAWMPYLGVAFATDNGDLISGRPCVSAWWARISARPEWRGMQRGGAT